jgi:hypothetical protein
MKNAPKTVCGLWCSCIVMDLEDDKWKCCESGSRSTGSTLSLLDPDPDPLVRVWIQIWLWILLSRSKNMKSLLLCDLFLTFYLWKKIISNKQKTLFFVASWRSMTKNNRIRTPASDPLVRGIDPRIQIRIRIHTKMSWIRNTVWDCCGTESLHREPQTRRCQGGGSDETTFENPATAWSPGGTLLYVWSKSYRGWDGCNTASIAKANCVSSVCLKSLRLLLYVFGTFFSATYFAALEVVGGGAGEGHLAFPLVGLAELEGLGGGAGGGVVLPHQAHRPLHQAQPGHLHHTPSYT